jgi:signal transduction histidine kinase
VELAGDLTGCWDAGRMSEVLSNLMGNALQYATPGTTVVVSAHSDGADVVVAVKNQGEPIPADVLPFIFEPFRRARQLEKSATGNLGLGLYIAHEIVRSHGGSLDGRSADGVTSFVMHVPRDPVSKA